jgi:hypothetical protein
MKLAVIGSRSFSDIVLFEKTLISRFSSPTPDLIISGGAAGADRIAANYAKKRGIPLKEFLPDWKTHGNSAGIIRNADIIQAADWVLAFWDGTSRGTANSLTVAKRLKKPTVVIYF